MPANTTGADAGAPRTFREAFEVLQQHAETLRRTQEPNIDDLVNVVTESVAAYKVCKARIQAVEQALERTLGEVEVPAAQDNVPNATSVSTPGVTADDEPTAKSGGPRPPSGVPASGGKTVVDDFDDDIPF
jgi:exodeoxyribonuclease VII small subunit